MQNGGKLHGEAFQAKRGSVLIAHQTIKRKWLQQEDARTLGLSLTITKMTYPPRLRLLKKEN